MAQAMKDEIKSFIHSILIPHPKGLTVDQLLKEYSTFESKPLPYRLMGYRSPVELLADMSDSIRFIHLPSGISVVQAKPDENVSHIHQMVVRQNNSGNKVMKNVDRMLRGNMYQNRNLKINGAESRYIDSKHYYQKLQCSTSGHQAPAPELESGLASYTTYVTTHLKNLLQSCNSYPEGVEMRLLHQLFFEKFHHRIDMRILGFESAPEYFYKHSDTFFVWEVNGIPRVCLKPYCGNTDSAVKDSFKSCSPSVPKFQQPQLFDRKKLNIQHSSDGPEPISSISCTPAQKIRNHQPAQISEDPIGGLVESLSKYSISNNSSSYLHPSQPAMQGKNLPSNFGVSRPRVKNVFTSDMILKYQGIPPDVGDLEYFFIIVAEVYSPERFYFFLRESRTLIETLTDDMNVFYSVNSNYIITREETFIGQVVAAQYTDLMWYRGKIMAYHRNQFEIFYFDYGSTVTVDIENIRHLHAQFTNLPIQAMRGRIFGICPRPEHTGWPLESAKEFLNMVKGSKVIAAAKMKQEYAESNFLPVFVLTLVDTNTETDIHISDCLVNKRLAIVDPSDAIEISDPSSIPLVSPSPTVPFPLAASNPHFLAAEPINAAVSPPCHAQASSPEPFFKSLNYMCNMFRSETIGSITPQELRPSIAEPLNSKLINNVTVQRQVKPLEMSGGRKIHVIRIESEFFLSGIEMATLLPMCETEAMLERKIAQMKMNVECKVIHAQAAPNIFIECVTLDVPWIKDDSGDLIEVMKLYPLKIVVPLLFVFGVKDKEVSQAIDKQMKNINDPHWM